MSDWYRIHKTDTVFDVLVRDASAARSTSLSWEESAEWFMAWINVVTKTILLVDADAEQFNAEGSAQLPGHVKTRLFFPEIPGSIVASPGRGVFYSDIDETGARGVLIDRALEMAATAAAEIFDVPYDATERIPWRPSS